jgi:hypothetical protein
MQNAECRMMNAESKTEGHAFILHSAIIILHSATLSCCHREPLGMNDVNGSLLAVEAVDTGNG